MYETMHSAAQNRKASQVEQLLRSEEQLRHDLPQDAFKILKVLHASIPGVMFRPSELIAVYPEDMPAPTRNVHFRGAKKAINEHPLSENSVIQHGTRGGTKYALARYVIEPILPKPEPSREVHTIFELALSRPSRLEGVYPRVMYYRHELLGMVVLHELLKKTDSEHKKISDLMPLASVLEPKVTTSKLVGVVKDLSQDPHVAGAMYMNEDEAYVHVENDAAHALHAHLPNYARAILRAAYLRPEGVALIDAINYAQARKLPGDPSEKQLYTNAASVLAQKYSHHLSLHQRVTASGVAIPWLTLRTLDERLSEKLAALKSPRTNARSS